MLFIALFDVFSYFVISDNFTTEQCHSEGSDGVRNFCEASLGVIH